MSDLKISNSQILLSLPAQEDKRIISFLLSILVTQIFINTAGWQQYMIMRTIESGGGTHQTVEYWAIFNKSIFTFINRVLRMNEQFADDDE